MAEIRVTEEAQGLARDLESLLATRGVVLSEGARGLLLLATEEWTQHPPRISADILLPQAAPISSFASIILSKVAQEQHVVRYSRLSAEVPFFEFLYALGKTGRDVLRHLIDKGL